jgi:ergothioneine biosynthesis protein EgtB
MLAIGKSEAAAVDLLQRFNDVRSYTESLCEPLEIEDYIPQPTVDVSPPKWNIAHTTWFFEEMVLKHFVRGYKVFDERFGFLFNSYYNSIGERTSRDHRGDLSRPTVKHVFAYRKHVDEAMAELLSSDVPDDLRELVILGLNHEQQHQELFLTDLKYTFSTNPLDPVYRENFAPSEKAESKIGGFVEIEGGTYEIGYAGEGFCFDNELGRHTVLLDDFAIAESLVTNGEFATFVADGGYKDFRLWHSDGWEWVNQNRVVSPLYWREIEDEWRHFTLGGLRWLPLEAPACHISYYEASAFAEWSGMRLPTEFEWEAASGKFDWGLRWEWTNSAYLPYPGFAKAAGAVGEYNGKFMINQMVLRGASAVTPHGHSRNTYRNFFQPHLRWQFTGLRMAK